MFKAVHKEKRMFINLKGLCLTCVLALAAITCWPTSAGTATSDSATLQMNYEIAAIPLTLLNSTDLLDFGQITLKGVTPSTTPLEVGQVKLNAETGVRTVEQTDADPGTSVKLSGGTNFERAQFSVTGEPLAFYNIDITTPMFGHDQSTGSLFLEAFLFQFSQNGGSIGGLGQTDANGNDSVFVGGDMVVTDDAVNGGYSGTVEITVFY